MHVHQVYNDFENMNFMLNSRFVALVAIKWNSHDIVSLESVSMDPMNVQVVLD